MTTKEFISVCDSEASSPAWPAEWPPLLRALALDRSGDWDGAHSIAQDDSSSRGSAVHAFLHREEGVQWNAEYWYGRAGRPPFKGSIVEEWISLASELLA